MNFATPQRAVLSTGIGSGSTSFEPQQPGTPAGSYDFPSPWKLYYQVAGLFVAANANSYCAPSANQAAATATPQVPTNANFAVEFDRLIDAGNYIVPDRDALRTAGTSLLNPAFGAIRRIINYLADGTPVYDPTPVPCTVDWVEGFDPSAIAAGKTKFRLLLNPRPNGSVSAEFLTQDQLEVVFARNLPAISIPF